MSNKNKSKNIERTRDSSEVTPDQAITQGLASGDLRDPNNGTRPARVPMNQGMNLDVSGYEFDKANYAYHFFYDDPARPGRIEQCKAAYWEHCSMPNSDVHITRPSGAGLNYLMQLPMQYHLEDKALKKQKVLATMDAETQIGVNEYAPDAKGHSEGGKSAIVGRSMSDNPYS